MLIGGRCLNTPGALGNQRKKPPRVTTWNRRLQGKATASRFTHPTAEHVQPSLIVMRLEKRLPLSFSVCPGLTVKSLDSQWFIPKIILSKKFKMRKKKTPKVPLKTPRTRHFCCLHNCQCWAESLTWKGLPYTPDKQGRSLSIFFRRPVWTHRGGSFIF